jgi:hypothetical protein
MICQDISSYFFVNHYNDHMEFSDWITQKYVNWRGASIGNDKSISEFARQIGVKQSIMAQWMKAGGKIPRDHRIINLLVSYFGNEIYDVLGLDKPRSEIDDLLALVPDDLRSLVKEVRAEYISELVAKGIESDTPEARQIVKDAFDKRGLKVIMK